MWDFQEFTQNFSPLIFCWVDLIIFQTEKGTINSNGHFGHCCNKMKCVIRKAAALTELKACSEREYQNKNINYTKASTDPNFQEDYVLLWSLQW